MLDFRLVVLKGIIEQNKPDAYFGDNRAINYWIDLTKSSGFIEEVDGTLMPSLNGVKAYNDRELYSLPREGKAYYWNNKEKLEQEIKFIKNNNI